MPNGGMPVFTLIDVIVHVCVVNWYSLVRVKICVPENILLQKALSISKTACTFVKTSLH